MEQTTAGTDYDSLSEAYTAALEAHKAEVRKARGLKARRALRAAHPINSFWPQFERLAHKDGRGRLLMVTHLKDRGLMRRAASAEAQRLYRELGASDLGSPWYESVLENLARDQRLVGVPFFKEMLALTIEGSKVPEVQASAMYSLGRMLLVSADEEDRVEGRRLIDTLVALHPTSEQALAIAEELFELTSLGVGCEAPDFEATTLEGHEFHLSDYRGKVVLIDFYGFW